MQGVIRKFFFLEISPLFIVLLLFSLWKSCSDQLHLDFRETNIFCVKPA